MQLSSLHSSCSAVRTDCVFFVPAASSINRICLLRVDLDQE